MSKCAGSLGCIIFVALVIFQEAETTPSKEQNRDRAILTYDEEKDICRDLDDNSGEEAQAAANLSCRQAFDAIDHLKGNSCEGWHSAECRLLPGFTYFQCSCWKPPSPKAKIRTFLLASFRECAKDIRREDFANDKTPALSPVFVHRQTKIVQRAEQKREAKQKGEKAPSSEESDAENSVRHGTRAARRLGKRPSTSKGKKSARQKKIKTVSKCEICQAEFYFDGSLQDHMVLHGGGKYCEKCGQRFPDASELKEHYGPCTGTRMRDGPFTPFTF